MYVEDSLKSKVNQLLNRPGKNLGDAIGIDFISFKKDEIQASMPVDERTIQPFGVLHGGASVALAETVASVGAWLNLENEEKRAVGIEINANHLKSVTEGEIVIAKAVPLHRGSQIQIWEVKIHTSDENLVCVSRCTLAVI